MQWGNLLNAKVFIHLWVEYFFPKWLSILHLWLTQSPNYNEITEWYLSWKNLFPEELLKQPMISAQFNKALEMMNQSSSGNLGKFEQFKKEEQNKMKTLELKDIQKSKAKLSHNLSLKEKLDMYSQKHGISFIELPSKKRDEKPAYSFGTKQLQIERDTLYVMYDGKWTPIELDDLVLLELEK